MSLCMKCRLAIVSLTASLVLGACVDGQEETVVPQLAVFALVTFASTDGVQLSGPLFGQGRQGVILAHMFPADQESRREFTGELAGLVYLALPFDFRGYGDSEEDQEFDRIDRDVEGALDFLEQRGVEDVFLIGASVAGTASLKVASRRSVSGVVIVSSPVAFQGLNVLQDILHIQEPVLFMASGQDGPAHESVLLIAGLAETSAQTLVLPGIVHGTDMLDGTTHQSVRDAIMDFLEEN
jgi:hypothetical protein